MSWEKTWIDVIDALPEPHIDVVGINEDGDCVKTARKRPENKHAPFGEFYAHGIVSWRYMDAAAHKKQLASMGKL